MQYLNSIFNNLHLNKKHDEKVLKTKNKNVHTGNIKSYEYDRLPDDWKKAIISPTYTGGFRHEPENYHPVQPTA